MLSNLTSNSSGPVPADFAIVALRVGVVQASAFLLIPILIKSLGTEAFGAWAQYKSALRMLTPLVTLNLSYGLIRYIPSASKTKQMARLLSTSCLATLGAILAGIGLYLARDFIARSFLGGQVEIVVVFTMMLPSFALTHLLLDYLRAQRDVLLHSIVSAVLALSVPLGFIGLTASGGSLITCLIYYLAMQLVALTGLSVIILRSYPFTTPDFAHIPELLTFSLPLLAASFQFTVVEFSDRFLVSLYLGLEETGTYTSAYQIGAGVQLFLTPFTFLLPAIVSKQWDNSKQDELNRLLTDSAAVFVAIAVAVIILFSFYGQPLLSWISNSSIADSATTVLLIAAASYVLFGVFAIAGQILFASKRSRVYGALWFLSMVANIVLNIILIPTLGINGAALATFASYAVLLASFSVVFSGTANNILNKRIWLLLLAGATAIGMTLLLATVAGGGILRFLFALPSLFLWFTVFRLLCPQTFNRVEALLGKG